MLSRSPSSSRSIDARFRAGGRGLACAVLIPGFAIALAVLIPGFAAAQMDDPYEQDPKPAVDGVNGAVFGSYGYEEVASGTTGGGGSSTFLPANETMLPGVGGVLTFPIGFGFGGRALAAASSRSTQHPAEGAYPGGVENGYLVDAGFDLFARNPDSGFFGVGYRFKWGDPAEGGADSLIANGLNTTGGFYIPDQGMGPIDWRASFTWLRGRVEGPGFSEDADEFSGVASSGWYMTESFRFTGQFLWSLDRPAASPEARDLRGGVDLAWLLPLGRVRYLTLGAYGTGGKLRTELAAPASRIDRTAWSVGGRVTFNFPGATSLVQLTRERL